MYRTQAVRAAIVALLAVLLGAGSASAATDHVVITGGVVVPAGQTAGDVVVLDGTVRIAGHVTGDVVSVAGPVRVSGRVDGDLIAVSDRAFLGSTARVGGDLRYGDETPVLARGARVGGKVSNEDWADSANGWGWVSALAWWLAVSVSTLIVGAAPCLAGAGRAVRGRAGGARAPRRDDRLGCRDRDRRCRCSRSWRSSRSWAYRSVSRSCWPRFPCWSSPTRLPPGSWGDACCATARSRPGRRSLPAGGSCACWPSSRSPVRSSGSRRRSWDSERWPSRCGGPAGRARPRGGPRRRPRALPHQPPEEYSYSAFRAWCRSGCHVGAGSSISIALDRGDFALGVPRSEQVPARRPRHLLRERSREAPGSPDRWNSGVPGAFGAPSRDGRQEC